MGLTMRADTDDLYDAEELAQSLTGFEEIAIETRFRFPLSEMTSTTVLRALLFVVEKRDGMAEVDAFNNVMLMRLGDVAAHFVSNKGADLGKASSETGTKPGPTS